LISRYVAILAMHLLSFSATGLSPVSHECLIWARSYL
jgi:hypothetical protein